MDFGNLFKDLRIKQEMTLRAFCDKYGFDMEGISKIERGIYPPPSVRTRLIEYAKALGIPEGGDDWILFFDLAARADRSENRTAEYHRNVLDRLPILFRAQSNKEMDNEKLDQIFEIVQES